MNFHDVPDDVIRELESNFNSCEYDRDSKFTESTRTFKLDYKITGVELIKGQFMNDDFELVEKEGYQVTSFKVRGDIDENNNIIIREISEMKTLNA